ncbi:MAG: hypothetical protein ACK5ML_13940 [Lachnospiraceae bacterium]
MKRTKISQGKKKSTEAKVSGSKSTVTGNWLYLLNIKTDIRQVQKELESFGYRTEIWEEAGVLEMECKEGVSIDFEAADLNRADQSTLDFFEQNGVQSVYLVSFSTAEYETVMDIFKEIVTLQDRFFCADTEEFKPDIR